SLVGESEEYAARYRKYFAPNILEPSGGDAKKIKGMLRENERFLFWEFDEEPRGRSEGQADRDRRGRQGARDREQRSEAARPLRRDAGERRPEGPRDADPPALHRRETRSR